MMCFVFVVCLSPYSCSVQGAKRYEYAHSASYFSKSNFLRPRFEQNTMFSRNTFSGNVSQTTFLETFWKTFPRTRLPEKVCQKHFLTRFPRNVFWNTCQQNYNLSWSPRLNNIKNLLGPGSPTSD